MTDFGSSDPHQFFPTRQITEKRAIQRLRGVQERVVDSLLGKLRLERGDVPVDDAIALFRRGEELYRTCVERLQGAELRIEELAPSDPGT